MNDISQQDRLERQLLEQAHPHRHKRQKMWAQSNEAASSGESQTDCAAYLIELVFNGTRKYKGFQGCSGRVALSVRLSKSRSPKCFEFLLCFMNIRVVWDSENKWYRVLLKNKKDYHKAMFAVDEMAGDVRKYICPQLYQRI